MAHTSPGRGERPHRAASLYLDLAADGTELDLSQRSLPRRALMLGGAALLLLGAPVSFAATAYGAGGEPPQGVLVKYAVSGDEDDDDGSGPGGNSGSGGGEDSVASEQSVSEPSAPTDGVSTGDGASAPTDGLSTGDGASEHGNRGPGGGPDSVDGTRGDDGPTTLGQTAEARDAATRAETVGATDRGNRDTGASTRGETDPGDDTGKTERR